MTVSVSTLAVVNAGLKVAQGADGFSFKVDGSTPAKGYAVALANQPVFRVRNFSQTSRKGLGASLAVWVRDNAKAFGADTLLGGWYDHDADIYEVEPSRLVGNKRDAIKLAKANNQVAIFNLGTFEEIATGGTGNR